MLNEQEDTPTSYKKNGLLADLSRPLLGKRVNCIKLPSSSSSKFSSHWTGGGGRRTSFIAYLLVQLRAMALNRRRSLRYMSATSGSMATAQNGSVSKLWTLINTLAMVRARDQLCWMQSRPISPCLEMLGWKILVAKRTEGGRIG